MNFIMAILKKNMAEKPDCVTSLLAVFHAHQNQRFLPIDFNRFWYQLG